MEKWEKNHHFWEISRGGTGTTLCGTGTISVLSTGTGAGTGTQCSVLDKCSYFGNNMVISYPI